MAAHFFLPDHVTLSAKEELVTSVITELGLGKARDTNIGNEKVRGISGGERKRASIAVQLISNPAVLFLDEPTSGLDSFQSQAVMESMKNMALNGRLVISIIHQPRSSIFDMFDQLLLLSAGRTMYLGVAEKASLYFSNAGYPIPTFFNPADYYLDILSPDARSSEMELTTSQRIAFLGDHWMQHQVDRANSLTRCKREGVGHEQLSIYPLTITRFGQNFLLLFWRSWSEITRDVPTIMLKLCLSTFFACIIGGMYNNLGDDQESVYNRQGMLFIITLNQAFNAVIGVLTSFPKEKVIVNRYATTGCMVKDMAC
jgi:ABC-type multidrug transport system ATPase subunit